MSNDIKQTLKLNENDNDKYNLIGWYDQRIRMEEFEKVEKQMPNRPPPVQLTIQDRYGK